MENKREYNNGSGIRAKITLQRETFLLDVDLQLPAQGLSAIYGASGSGKTTLLRCLAGLEKSISGNISFAECCWHSDNNCLPTHLRQIGYVFQSANLFPHLNVRQNIAYAEKRVIATHHQHDFDSVIQMLNISHLLTRPVAMLSGGEAQRVAIARALMSQPQILFMDEPLASLDTGHKREILPYLEKIKTECAVPIIYVSHSMDEISRLADYLVVMEAGRIVESDTLQNLLGDIRFARKLGMERYSNDETTVSINAQVGSVDSQWQLAEVTFDGGHIWLQNPGCHEDELRVGQDVRIKIRAADISLALVKPQQSSIANVLPATIIEIDLLPDSPIALVKLGLGNTQIIAQLTRRSVSLLDLTVGKSVWAQIKAAALVP